MQNIWTLARNEIYVKLTPTHFTISELSKAQFPLLKISKLQNTNTQAAYPLNVEMSLFPTV